MKRFLAPAVITVAALSLAACGSDDDDTSSVTTAAAGSTAASASGSATTVKVTQIEGFGAVLTDAEGHALYMSDEEAASPDVVCTDACEQFWAPLEASSGSPTGVDELGVEDRPDGTKQVTYDGHRLYTFTQESAGKVTGDGFSDTFGGQQFTWHVVVTDEAGVTPATGGGTPTGSNQETGTTAPGGGYGY
jgi:predicted lipoprotein with Yx(FWY)xxD motif